MKHALSVVAAIGLIILPFLLSIPQVPQANVTGSRSSATPEAAIQSLESKGYYFGRAGELPHVTRATLSVPRGIDPQSPEFLCSTVYCGHMFIASPLVDFKEVCEVPTLQILDLDDTMILNGDLIHIKKARNLKTLFLQNTQISGQGIQHLVGTGIEHLALKGPSIDDSSVPYLCRMTSLRKLCIANSKISDAGWRMLNASLAQCEVHH